MDPHDSTTNARKGTIRLEKGSLSAGAVFTVGGTNTPGFPLFQGCTLVLSDGRDAMKARFVLVPLDVWIDAPIVIALFKELGINVEDPLFPAQINPFFVPMITDTDRALCTPDPQNPGGTGPGILSFQAVIQFNVPQ
jgi:hypothetical protein